MNLILALLFLGVPASETKRQRPPIKGCGTSDIPLLPCGNHLGMMVGYEKLPSRTAAAARAHLREALAAGMRVGRVHTSWADLEPRHGRYRLSNLRKRLRQLRRDGLAPFVLLETIDSEEYVLPPDLMDPNDPTKLAGGRRLNDPVIVTRFRRLLDRIVPEMVRRGAWLLSVGNEPENVLDDLGDDTPKGIAYWNSIVDFARLARHHVKTREPRLAVTMTLTQGGLEAGRTFYGQMMDAVDVASFNYYCQDPQWRVQDASVVDAEIAQMVATAGGRSVVLQEVGCPSGYTDRPSVVGGTPEAQREFFAAVARALDREPQLRAIFQFTLVDWSPALAEATVAPLREAGYHQLADQFKETLRTWGLIRYKDGATRPAWDAFIGGLEGP